jgi:non-specific serine/threonine protein kinase
MVGRTSAVTPEQFTNFGELLKYLRRRAGLTQRELSFAVGYSNAQISRQEQNLRIPDRATLTARFVPALHLEHESEWVERLLALAAQAGQEAPRPARVLSATAQPRHNLPVELTSFIGREKEMAEVERLLACSRLLTLTGSGGCGKTRLALQVAGALAERVDEYPDGVWLADLAPLSDPGLVPRDMATALGVREEAGLPVLTLLTNYLQGRSLLLVLDNCDHLIEGCARLAEALLRHCPNVQILATSRDVLGIAGERAWRVPPLTTPEAQPLPPFKRLRRYEAVRLFVDRAATAKPGFELTQQNAAAVVRVCQRLDGMPLAIELAARVSLLRVEQIAARLDDRFGLLTGGSRTALPRHRTLRAAIDWSYDLLPEVERRLLQRLAVFAGGWTLEAAEAVCAGEGLEVTSILELLGKLVNKSLVVAEWTVGSETRYRMLETIREYAREQLLASGTEGQLRRRHLDFFLWLAEEAEPMVYGPQDNAWLDRLEVEHDNLRAALGWVLSAGDHPLSSPEAGLRLAGKLWTFWYLRGHLSEGREWLAKLLALPAATPRTVARAKALAGAAFLAGHQGDFEQAQPLFDESLALIQALSGALGNADASFRPTGTANQAERTAEGERKPSDEVWAVPIPTSAFLLVGEGGTTPSDEVRPRDLDAPARWDIAYSLAYLAIVAWLQEDYERSLPIGRASVALFRELGNKPISAWVLGGVGWATLYLGDHEQGIARLEESVAGCREAGESLCLADTLWSLGHVARKHGELDRAAASVEEGLTLSLKVGYKVGVCGIIQELAAVAAARGHSEPAARLWRAAEAIAQVAGYAMPPYVRADHDRNVMAVRAQLGEEAFAAAWAEGRRMTLEQAVEYALARSE